MAKVPLALFNCLVYVLSGCAQSGAPGQAWNAPAADARSAAGSTKPAAALLDAGTADRLRAECGIEIVGLRPTAGGEMIKLSYRVTDLARAKAAFTKPLALVEGSAPNALTVVDVARLGPLRQKPRTAGKTYYVLFSNPGPRLRAGDRASLLIGERRYEGLVIR